MAKLVTLPGSRPADEGESLLVRHLEAHLPGTYTLFPNIEIIEPGRPAFEYDLVVVAPHAVYVIEAKRWRGGIRGDDHEWLVAGQHRRPNPWPTANNKARVLKSLIRRRQPSCDPWVEAAIAIVDEQGELDLRGQCASRVFRHTDLPAFLTDPSYLGNHAGNLRPTRAYIEKAIQEGAGGRTAQKLRLGDYEVVETLSRRDAVAEYLARNVLLRSEKQVRLRAFSYNPYLSDDDQVRRREIIRREAEALQRIGPRPNLIALQGFFTDPNDPNLFVEITDWSEAGNLRALMSEGAALSLERKLELAQGIAAGLRDAHAEGVIHRDIRPENILIGRDGEPRLMNFDHARLSQPGNHTISPIQRDPSEPRNYLAPELLGPHANPSTASDLYGLGMILYEMLVGKPLYESEEEALQASEMPAGPLEHGAADVPTTLNTLVRRLTSPRPEDRPQSAAEVLAEIKALQQRPSATVAEPPESEPVPALHAVTEPAIFQAGDLIDGKYQVQKVLAAGGSGRVYQVYDAIWDQTWALKVFNDTDLSLDFLKQEVQTLGQVSHPHIVRIHTWGRLAQSGRLYLVSEYVDGEELSQYTAPDQRLPIHEAVRALLDLLSALEALHPDVERIDVLRGKMDQGKATEAESQEYEALRHQGWLHRDIKPANLMLTRDGLKLVDFNIAAKVGDVHHTFAGTRGYMLPSVGTARWSTDDDLFGTGIVFYELVTGHHPYPNREPRAGVQPADPRKYVPELRHELAEILQRAVSCDSDRHYHSAQRLRADLERLNGIYLLAPAAQESAVILDLDPEDVGKANYNPYVTRFRRLYSQAHHDNSGTRGLDDLARLTYVETRLDRLLLPAVLDGQYRLVVITGNAGDGKTAFIKNLENVVTTNGGGVEQLTANSSTFTYQGRKFYTNYDGSQDEGAERANDQVLSEFFAPFEDARIDQAPNLQSVHLIAINEGRLIDFFSARLRDGSGDSAGLRFRRLGSSIISYFDPDDGSEDLPAWLLLVDLNQRSVVARDPALAEPSIFERQADAFLKPELWAPCQRCERREECFIKFNADSLADPTLGPIVRERLRTLFEIVHLRRRLHITMRDMRSALSWLLTHGCTCDDVASQTEAPQLADRLDLLYFNAYAADAAPAEGRGDDRLVRLLREIDPAQVANPAADRALHFQGPESLQQFASVARSPLPLAWLGEWELPVGGDMLSIPYVSAQYQRRHAMLRRKAFFERRDDGWKAMLPYQHLDDFRNVTSGKEGTLGRTKELMVKGISLAEGARKVDLAQRFVCLRAGRRDKATIKSFRLFPSSDFQLEVPQARASTYVEFTPDRIIFYHEPHRAEDRNSAVRRAELVVSLDLLELLVQIGQGFAPSPNDVGGTFLNLTIFKNALMHLPYRRGLLTRDDRQYYELVLDQDAVITLQPWSPERIAADEA